ncbi:MAG: RNA polymerase sigma factor [Bacteroidales bacterium]|jgi:RNA polymerase sigma factor (sigma-70 family)|nr:RNA polymerase sigma factor [Bacteroidales bacterium]
MTIKEYNECVKNSADRVYCFVIKQVKDSWIAEDIVQDSFMKLWEKKELVDKQKAKTYLYRIAYNNIVDNFRKNKYFVNESNIIEQETRIDYSDAKEIIDKALDTLPQIQKAIILLKDNEGYSYEEISQMLDISMEKVKVYLYRARVKMKEMIVKKENIL